MNRLLRSLKGVNANFVQFGNDFTGLDVEVGMLLQCAF